MLRLDQRTTLVLSAIAPEPEESSVFGVLFGAIQSFSRRPQTLEVDTPYVNATIEGTEFALRVVDGQSELTVIEGRVLAKNDLGSVRVSAGEAAVAQAGSAPRMVLVARPQDAVVWGLYFPQALAFPETSAAPTPVVDEARKLLADNRPDAAIALLERSASTTDDRLFHASALLAVGRADEANRVLGGVLSRDPDNATALALSAVIDIVGNDRDAALDKSRRAVAAAPDTVAPHIALSLAQQADFRLEAARDTLLEATRVAPESALVWARLSEIWLSLGYRDRSIDAAERALQIDPKNTRAHAMRGFAALSEFDTETAAEAFLTGIELDQADPLPRLGLGLAKIREGDLAGGRSEIDKAVALDSTRSLLRSYLAKGYFEEDRNDLAAEQLKIAKELDPRDPTPHLYDAIRLQTENRPGEALGEIQESIRKNENRAVYRGRLQLDSDQAARGASQGRIYDDLGFVILGERAATGSIFVDPANAAAHRFLADIYRSQRRVEFARVSELTRAQLLQDVSLNLIQPSLTETNLNLVSSGGPANAGFNEFNALFASDGFRFTATGLFGMDVTRGGEMALALQHGPVAISVGGFHFTSDGFRPNFDVEHQIYTAFFQFDASPELHLQMEVRSRKTENGDLFMNFDPNVFDATARQSFAEDSVRFGLRYNPDPNNTTLVSLIAADRESEQSVGVQIPACPPFLPPPCTFFIPGAVVTQLDGHSVQAEVQHIYKDDFFNLTAGAGVTERRRERPLRLDIFPPGPVPPVSRNLGTLNADSTAYNAYFYGTVNLPYDVALTGGVSFDVIDAGTLQVNRVSPKVGFEWRPIEDLVVRGAYFESVKGAQATDRTIEPTTVAGFNQLFDDAIGTVSKRMAFGVDYAATDWLFVGAEASFRKMEVPFLNRNTITNTSFSDSADHKEQRHRAYIYALPHPRVPVSLSVVYDRFEAETNLLTNDPTALVPTELTTISVPLQVGYFDPSGFYASGRATYVHQEVERAPLATLPTGESDFFLLDASVGYRFPNNRGSVSIEARNLTDQDFRFQDNSFRDFGSDPSTGPYFPGLNVMGRFTVNF